MNDKKQEQEVSIERNLVIKTTRADSLRISNLTKRHSDMSKFCDAFLGASLHKFPSSKLPLNRAVLQRYRALRTEGSRNIQQNQIITTITMRYYYCGNLVVYQ